MALILHKKVRSIFTGKVNYPDSGVPLLSKFDNLSIREILVVALAYAHPHRLWERGRGRGRGRLVARQPDEGWRMPSLLGNRRFSRREIA